MRKLFQTPAVPPNKRDPSGVMVLVALTSLLALVTVALAGVPQPDAIFYGSVTINGRLITALDDVVVVGRVNGRPQFVGRYRMGEGGTAGDNYVLRVRLEAPVTGMRQSPNAARLGEDVQLYVVQGSNPEVLAATISLTAPGMLRQRDLSVSVLPANCVADGAVDLADHQAFKNCLTAPDVPATPECSCADVDGDGDVDLRDWAWMQAGFTGS